MDKYPLIRITPETHRRLKIRAAEENKTMSGLAEEFFAAGLGGGGPERVLTQEQEYIQAEKTGKLAEYYEKYSAPVEPGWANGQRMKGSPEDVS